jgi:hypothetical protein
VTLNLILCPIGGKVDQPKWKQPPQSSFLPFFASNCSLHSFVRCNRERRNLSCLRFCHVFMLSFLFLLLIPLVVGSSHGTLQVKILHHLLPGGRVANHAARKRTHAHKSREKTAAQFRFHQGQNSRVYVKFLSLSAQLSLLSGGAWIQVKLPFPPSLIRPLFVPFPNMQRAASIKRSGLGHFSTSFLRFNLGHACESFFR